MNGSRARQLRKAGLGRKRLGLEVRMAAPSQRRRDRAVARADRRADAFRPAEHWWRAERRRIKARRAREAAARKAAAS